MMALVSHTPMPLTHATSEVKPSSDESPAWLPPDWPRDLPLARVRTCGTLAVEVLLDLRPDSHGHLEPVYGAPEARLLKIPGMSTAFLLLAELSSQPDYFASKDFLAQTLSSSRRNHTTKKESDQVEDRGLTRPENVVSLLRKLLYPPKLRGLRGERELRQGLVRYVGATDQSGPGYRLASFPLLLLSQSMCKRGIAYASAFLGYHLNQIGRPEEALPMIQQALDFHEQKYGETSILADSYSEKAQALIALERFQEALLCDELAMTEIRRWAREGDIRSRNEIWTYQVNRGRLYVRLGRMEEAEQLLREAEPRLSESRRNYRMFAKEALDEIAQWKSSVLSPQHQLDWRWVERFRELVTYDSYWWLTWAGPFTAEEQHEWDSLFALPLDETTVTTQRS
jgi:tetratricopeptide (TPR) repeat protein